MSDARDGCYVYCVVRADERPSLDGVTGVAPGAELRMLAAGDLGAVVSDVPLDEFGAEALERNLEDLAWLERTARAHQAVLEAVLPLDAVVPLRLCTIFRDEQHAREMLEREHDQLRDALERVRGRLEWSVKLLADPRALEAAAAERGLALAASGADAGRAYLERKRAALRGREDARALAESAAQEAHAALSGHAAAATLLPPQDPRLSGRRGAMLLNGAYLVERSRGEDFAAAVREQAELRRAHGIELDLSGPWAPYNFVAR